MKKPPEQVSFRGFGEWEAGRISGEIQKTLEQKHSRAIPAEKQNPAFRSSSIQTVTVGLGISPNPALRLVGYTTGRDFHPALKIPVQFGKYYNPFPSPCQPPLPAPCAAVPGKGRREGKLWRRSPSPGRKKSALPVGRRRWTGKKRQGARRTGAVFPDTEEKNAALSLSNPSVKRRTFGDPYENRTRDSAVKGRCLNRLTNGPEGSEIYQNSLQRNDSGSGNRI